MVELVDTLDSKSGSLQSPGSSPGKATLECFRKLHICPRRSLVRTSFL